MNRDERKAWLRGVRWILRSDLPVGEKARRLRRSFGYLYCSAFGHRFPDSYYVNRVGFDRTCQRCGATEISGEPR